MYSMCQAICSLVSNIKNIGAIWFALCSCPLIDPALLTISKMVLALWPNRPYIWSCFIIWNSITVNSVVRYHLWLSSTATNPLLLSRRWLILKLYEYPFIKTCNVNICNTLIRTIDRTKSCNFLPTFGEGSDDNFVMITFPSRCIIVITMTS